MPREGCDSSRQGLGRTVAKRIGDGLYLLFRAGIDLSRYRMKQGLRLDVTKRQTVFASKTLGDGVPADSKFASHILQLYRWLCVNTCADMLSDTRMVVGHDLPRGYGPGRGRPQVTIAAAPRHDMRQVYGRAVVEQDIDLK